MNESHTEDQVTMPPTTETPVTAPAEAMPEEAPPAPTPFTPDQIAARRQELFQQAQDNRIPLGESLTPMQLAQGIPSRNQPLDHAIDEVQIAKVKEPQQNRSGEYTTNGSKAGGD